MDIITYVTKNRNRIKLVIFIVLLEVFVFNAKFWITIGNQPITNLAMNDWSALPVERGVDYLVTDGFCVELPEINAVVENVYLLIETGKALDKNVLNIQLSLIDEGNSCYYSLPQRTISSALSNQNYISIYPYGKVSSIRIDFSKEIGTTINIKDIVINAHVPFHFSLPRLLIMLLVAGFVHIWLLDEYEELYDVRDRRQFICSAILCGLTALFLVLTMVKSCDPINDKSLDKYTLLAHSLAEGHTYLDMGQEDPLASLSNPYDFDVRTNASANYFWDYAYFNGKYYTYFGVVPVILFFLPYYLMTGSDLNGAIPYAFLLIFYVIGVFQMIKALVDRYGKAIPVKLLYLLQMTCALAAGGTIFSKRMCIYNMCILSGVTFTIWGLYFWFTSKAENKRWRIGRLGVGSLCMALVAGCRPQLLLGSFLAIPLFWEDVRDALVRRKISVKRLIAFGFPYVIVALCLMYYNQVRFGSPFDFGANYNLTTNDMRYRGWYWARNISGIWYFLFNLPSLKMEFPFIEAASVKTIYQGITIQENSIGGVLATNVILWPIFLLCRKKWRSRLSKRFESAGIVLFSLLSSLVIVIADSQMAGMLTRYKGDFSIFLYISVCLIIFVIVDYMDANKERRTYFYRGLALLAGITIAYSLLGILALYEADDYLSTNPIWYYHMQELFNII